MHFIIGLIIWAIISVILFFCMSSVLITYENILSWILGAPRDYTGIDYVRLIKSSGNMAKYTPADSVVTESVPAKEEATEVAAANQPAPSYESYLEGLRTMLVSRWRFLPEHVIDTALANPRELVLSTEADASSWSGLMLKAVSGWLAADTGAPANLIFNLLTTADIEDQYSLAIAEALVGDAAAAWSANKDMAPESTIIQVMCLLRRKERPLHKVGDYILGQAEHLRIRASDPSLASVFGATSLSEEAWMSMRFRASDC